MTNINKLTKLRIVRVLKKSYNMCIMRQKINIQTIYIIFKGEEIHALIFKIIHRMIYKRKKFKVLIINIK
jgi:hypothetical protein